VVEVDVEVARGLDTEIEPGVLPELLEHVVEEGDPRGRAGVPATVDLKREVDRGLLGDTVLL
jgi:hypothetical protein